MKQKLLKIYFKFFGFLAKKYLKKQQAIVIGITGSVGKTTTRMIIYDILKDNLKDKKIYTSNKNFNGELGLSFSILEIDKYTPSFFGVIKVIFLSLKRGFFTKKSYDVILLEYGIDHIGEMDFLLSITNPDFSIITKIDNVHSLQMGGKDNIAFEKYKLSKNTKKVSYLNIADEYFSKYFDEIVQNKVLYTTNTLLNDKLKTGLKIGKNNETYSTIFGENIKFYKDENNLPKTSFEFYFENKYVFLINSNSLQEENIGYMSIGIHLLNHLYHSFYNKSFFEDIDILDINLELQPSRFSIFPGINTSILLDSSYNGAPESQKQVLDNFINLKNNLYSDYEIILCLGEMRELGDYTKMEHEKLAKNIKNFENIFLVGKSMQEFVIPLLPQAKFFRNSKILGQNLKDFLQKNNDKKYLILFKGSQNTIFLEEAVKEVLGKVDDKNFLCRQEKYWIEIKNNFFNK
ncbi:hypothetical protein H3C61_02870 [Candidatus Gracilibacteria bacterium]|nr:hypothetical protein [Candidatus Gracilibacteria bacterium]